MTGAQEVQAPFLRVQIKGAIYAVDAPPVEFDQKLSMVVSYQRKLLRLPERPLLAL